MAPSDKGGKGAKRESKGGYPTLAAKRRAERRYAPSGGGTLRRGRKKVDDAAEDSRRLMRLKVRVALALTLAALVSLSLLAFGNSIALRAAWGMRALASESLEKAASSLGQTEARLIAERLAPIKAMLQSVYGVEVDGLYGRFVADPGPAWHAVYALREGESETRTWKAASGWSLAFRPAFSAAAAERRAASLSRSAHATWVETGFAAYPLGLKPGVAFGAMASLDSGDFAELAFAEAFALALRSGAGRRLSLEERGAAALTLGRAAAAEYLRQTLPPESQAPDAYRARIADAWTAMQLAAELWERIGPLERSDPSRERLKAIWIEAFRRDYAGRFRTNGWIDLGGDGWNDARLAAMARSYRLMQPWMRRYLEMPSEPERLWKDVVDSLAR